MGGGVRTLKPSPRHGDRGGRAQNCSGEADGGFPAGCARSPASDGISSNELPDSFRLSGGRRPCGRGGAGLKCRRPEPGLRGTGERRAPGPGPSRPSACCRNVGEPEAQREGPCSAFQARGLPSCQRPAPQPEAERPGKLRPSGQSHRRRPDRASLGLRVVRRLLCVDPSPSPQPHPPRTVALVSPL